MDQFRNFFNTCRIPCVKEDKLCKHFKTANEGTCPTHLLLMYRNRFFKINAFHRDNTLVNISEFYSQISGIINKYQTIALGIGIGALTADNRDAWAKVKKIYFYLTFQNSKPS